MNYYTPPSAGAAAGAAALGAAPPPLFLAPYFDLEDFLFAVPERSNLPLTKWYLTPGKSLTLPPLTKTIPCSAKSCPIPWIYAVTSVLLDSLTRATFLKAEFGFLGVIVLTKVTTPRFCGLKAIEYLLSLALKLRLKTVDLIFLTIFFLPFLTSWFVVGIFFTLLCLPSQNWLE